MERAFMLRVFGFMRFSEAEWDSVRRNLHTLLNGKL